MADFRLNVVKANLTAFSYGEYTVNDTFLVSYL
jgi:hypothetical protein